MPLSCSRVETGAAGNLQEKQPRVSQSSPRHPMNCSDSRRLRRLVTRLWRELRGSGGAPANISHATAAAEDDAYLYILLIMIFYGCLAGGLILAYTRSRKLESKHDPYHLYIERDWAAGRAGSPGGGRGSTLAAELHDSSFEEGVAAGAALEKQRGSGDSQHF